MVYICHHDNYCASTRTYICQNHYWPHIPLLYINITFIHLLHKITICFRALTALKQMVNHHTAPSYAQSSLSLSVFMPNIKYNTWHNHTIPRTILPTGTACIIIKPILIRMVTVSIILTFVFTVMPLPCTKLSRFFLYSLVDINQLWSFSELLAKQNAESIRKGNAGSTYGYQLIIRLIAILHIFNLIIQKDT